MRSCLYRGTELKELRELNEKKMGSCNKREPKPGVMIHVCNLRTEEEQASLSYTGPVSK